MEHGKPDLERLVKSIGVNDVGIGLNVKNPDRHVCNKR